MNRELTFKPEINKNTESLIKQQGGKKPIYERIDEIIKFKNKKH